MTLMLRALVATLVFVMPPAASGQALSVLHIKVVLLDNERKSTPVPRHALLVSDNPVSAAPRLIVTRLDGTADVRLRPGSYTVESDSPVAFHGRAYQWTQTVDIVAGRDTVLDLTADNAEVEPADSATKASAGPLENDPSFLLPRWQDSVVALWTPTTRASGFVIVSNGDADGDANGLVVTNQRVIGTATSVEVQLTPAVKVAASVLVADPVRDVAVLWIDQKVIASVRPVPLSCTQAPKPPVVNGQEIFTISVPVRQQKGMTSGTVSRVDPHGIVSDFILPLGSAGGPVFTGRGDLVGITSVIDEDDEKHQNDRSRRGDSRVVRIAEACDVVASAEKKMKTAAPPSGTHLPVEPLLPFPVDALEDAAKRRAGGLSPYQISSSTFDVAFITPVLTYAAEYQARQGRGRTSSKDTRTPDAPQTLVRPLTDFSNWSAYVGDFPPVLLVRVTPKLVEGFWTMVARGAARTQGVSIPPIRHFKSGFSRLRAFCGDAEVTPIHPFKLEQRVSESDAIYEGLYVFDPGALGPRCGTVKLVLYSEKEPEKGDTRVVDPSVVQQIWQDFAPYRALNHVQGSASERRSCRVDSRGTHCGADRRRPDAADAAQPTLGGRYTTRQLFVPAARDRRADLIRRIRRSPYHGRAG
jgi:S1-C subfamily serine protease